MRIGFSFFGCRKPSHIVNELQQWRSKGVAFVVFPYSENDLLFYKEAMSSAFAIAHDLGLAVWVDPWGVGGIFSGETPSWFLLYHPEVWQVRADGISVPHACPNAPRTLELLRTWIDTVAAAGAEWVMWDEPHWYIPGVNYWPEEEKSSSLTCHCRHCQERFYAQFHRPMPNQEDEDMQTFRHDSMRALLAKITAYTATKGLKNVVCWAPPEQLSTGLSPEEILALENVDKLAIDPYWFSIGRNIPDFFVPVVHQTMELCENKGKPLQVWLQGFRIPRGREQELLEAAEILDQLGVQEVAIWHHQEMSSLLPDDPQQLARTVDELLARFGEKR